MDIKNVEMCIYQIMRIETGENYIQYCAEYVILEILKFLDEWKK